MNHRPKSGADDLHVGDLVQRTRNGATFTIDWIDPKKRQAYWGYWTRDLVLKSTKTGAKFSSNTAHVQKPIA